MIRSRKIRLYPSRKQRAVFRSWFGAARFVYNKTIEYLQQPRTTANFFAIKGQLLQNLPAWCADVPYQIKSIACRDACQAVKAAKRKFQTAGFQHVSFRSRKNPKQSAFIPKSAVKAGGIYTQTTGELRRSETLPENRGDCRLSLENGRYFLSIPSKTSVRGAENQGRTVALDPGVRTFQTFYSQTTHGKIGSQAFSRIQRLCVHLDDLLSRMTSVKHKQRYRMKKAAHRIRWKIRDLVDELHWKTINFLVQHFDVILLPTFETQHMSQRATRKIGRKSVRAMLTFSHYRFKERLRAKCHVLGKTLIYCCEAYTSKTVSWTGELVHNLGGRAVIRSKKTGDVMDRDINGALGILLRALVDTPSKLHASCIATQVC